MFTGTVQLLSVIVRPQSKRPRQRGNRKVSLLGLAYSSDLIYYRTTALKRQYQLWRVVPYCLKRLFSRGARTHACRVHTRVNAVAGGSSSVTHTVTSMPRNDDA